MKKMIRKIVAVLLAVVVLISVLPKGFGADEVKAASKISVSAEPYFQCGADRGYIFRPENVQGKLPVVIFFHGYLSGQNQDDMYDYYENDAATKRKVKSALTYPIMLGIMTVGIVVVMLAFVVPTFRKSLSSLEVNPTGLTKVVYDISDFIVADGLYLLAGLFVIVLIFFIIGRTKKGRLFYDHLKVSLPLIKDINTAMIAARFSRSFGLLLKSGMDIIDAMETVMIVFDNKDIEKRFALATEDVRHGVALATAFEKYKIFPSILSQMVSVGEKTNSLDDILERSCVFFDEQVSASIESITGKIQPMMLIIMGGVIGTLFLAIYSPMIDIMQSMSSG